MSKATETITIRGLDADTKRRLRVLAAGHGRSMEEEVRSLIREAVKGPAKPDTDLGTAIHRRFARYGGVDLELPPRGLDREPPRFDE